MFVREDREANSRPPVVPVKVKVPNGSLTSSQNNHGSTPNQSQEVNNNKGVSTGDDVKHHLNSSQSNELSVPVAQETETQGDDVKSKQNVGEEEEEVEEEDEEDDSLIAELIN
jgi:hypothetical protein